MLRLPKGRGGERLRKRRENYRHVRLVEPNESEPFDEASKSSVMSKGSRTSVSRARCRSNLSTDCMASGVKAAGTQDQARLRNVRTHTRHVSECGGGHARSSDEASVMGVEQRGMGH